MSAERTLVERLRELRPDWTIRDVRMLRVERVAAGLEVMRHETGPHEEYDPNCDECWAARVDAFIRGASR